MQANELRSGAEIKVGDRLCNAIDGGAIGEVRSVRPYTGPLIDLLGKGTQLATLYGGQSMTVPAVSFFGIAA